MDLTADVTEQFFWALLALIFWAGAFAILALIEEFLTKRR